jgi:hypothetical protein
MICCDLCDEWYHLSCIKLTEEDMLTIAVFVCAKCKRKYGKETQYFEVPITFKDITQPIDDDYSYSIQNETYQVERVPLLESEADERKRRQHLFYLSGLAQADDANFRPLDITSEHNLLDAYYAKIILHKTKPVGYLTFTTGATALQQASSILTAPCLRQIFFVKSERRKGNAKQILHYFMNVMRFGVDERFIESPNENMCMTLLRYRYATKWTFDELNGNKSMVEKELTELIDKRFLKEKLERKNVCVFVVRNGAKCTASVYIPTKPLNFDVEKSIQFVHGR